MSAVVMMMSSVSLRPQQILFWQTATPKDVIPKVTELKDLSIWAQSYITSSAFVDNFQHIIKGSYEIFTGAFV